MEADRFGKFKERRDGSGTAEERTKGQTDFNFKQDRAPYEGTYEVQSESLKKWFEKQPQDSIPPLNYVSKEEENWGRRSRETIIILAGQMNWEKTEGGCNASATPGEERKKKKSHVAVKHKQGMGHS
ncbi:hypothetical protein llap_3406 [Limosa lapponica baueri]|uniref:Uncharacterized protein n=1 Tax=Limosa lapponica baueri TaxID=1758121 RepID=A0A2I0UJS8_LIMLA|nr:hypothetical protein llap_3406 [Limosa lapponica baueri]